MGDGLLLSAFEASPLFWCNRDASTLVACCLWLGVTGVLSEGRGPAEDQ